MDISLGRLRQLVTVAQCGSFSRAAAEMHISQPALSRSIAAIEERYGFPLFNRLGHGVELTSAGMLVIDQARTLLQDLQVFDSNLQLIGRGQSGRLSLGFAPLLASQLAARFVADFFSRDYRLQLRMLIRHGQGLLNALKNDEIELFFFPETHLDPGDDIEVEPVGAINPACVVRAGHPLLDLERVTLDDLSDYPWASSVEPTFAPEVPSAARLICDNYHILREALFSTDLVCVCSTEFVALDLAAGSLRAIQIEGLPLSATNIYVAKLRARVNSPLAAETIKRLRRYLRTG